MRVDIKGTVKQKSTEAFKKAEEDTIIKMLREASFSEIDNWVDSNITTLPKARELLKKMLLVMSYLLNKG